MRGQELKLSLMASVGIVLAAKQPSLSGITASSQRASLPSSNGGVGSILSQQWPWRQIRGKVQLVIYIYIYQWLREVYSTNVLATPIQLGGRGVIVQIDESLFRHKPRGISNDIRHLGFFFLMQPLTSKLESNLPQVIS